MTSYELNISIDTANAAFDSNPEAEIARILRDLADRIENIESTDVMRLRDINGNNVGTAHEVIK